MSESKATLVRGEEQGDPWIGRRLGDRYVLEDVVGAGATGVVYLARDRGGERYAVKLIDLRQSGFEADARDARERVENEILALTRLRSSHVVRFWDYLVLGESHVAVVMDHIDGVGLDELLMRGGALPQARAIEIARQIAVGMSEAHARGVLHRDLKPGNVLLEVERGGDFVRLIDFGLSYMMGSQHKTDGFVGTPLFASPEQFLGGDVGRASDIYSLGVMLFFLLTGHPPLDGKTVFALMRAHLEEEPPRLEELGGRRYPEALEELVAWMLRKDPEERPVTMHVVAQTLEAIQLSNSPEVALEAARWMNPEEERAIHPYCLACPSTGDQCSEHRLRGIDRRVVERGCPPHRVATSSSGLLAVVDQSNAILLSGFGEDGAILELELLWRPKVEVTALDVQPGWLVVGMRDGRVVVLDLGQSRVSAQIVQERGEGAAPRAVAIGGEGRSVVVAGLGEAQLFSLHGDRVLRQPLEGLGELTQVEFSYDGLEIIAAVGEELVVLSRAGSKLEVVRRAHVGEISALALSHDEYLLAIQRRDGSVRIEELDSGRKVATLRGAGESVEPIVFGASRSVARVVLEGEKLRLEALG